MVFTCFLLVSQLASAPSAGQTIPDTTNQLTANNRARAVANQFRMDLGSLERFYHVQESPRRFHRFVEFYNVWLDALSDVVREGLTDDEAVTIDRLIQQVADRKQDLLDFQVKLNQVRLLLPFAQEVIDICEARQRVEPIDSAELASRVDALDHLVGSLRKQLGDDSLGATFASSDLKFAADTTRRLTSTIREWYQFYDQYDPMFTWWLAEPFARFEKNLGQLNDEFQRMGEIERDAEPNAAAGQQPALAVEENGDQVLTAAFRVSGPELPTTVVPDLHQALQRQPNRIQLIIEEFAGQNRDRSRGERVRQRRADVNLEDWSARVDSLDYASLNFEEQIDYHLLKHRVRVAQRRDAWAESSPERLPLSTDDSGISGQPIGEEALRLELDEQLIPYSPAELVQIAEREYAWCQAEIKKAAAEMGFDDWRAAVEHVKRMHVQPGEQPIMIRDLAHEAMDYLDEHQLVTVPALARETWRMRMLSPERQLISPFFLGGEVIQVSFPTSAMRHADKLQSLRGNNIPFARATVHHELIPGHHLQGFTTSREKVYRQPFQTPFWLEGWALYWEMVLYDRGFPATPADRVGFLVWRSHRCARIIFSLNFHLGRMTPGECVDLLVQMVGFEPNNAAAEVRRSVGTGYGPLYQAAYMLGGLQFRALRSEFVDSGKISELDFHDLIMREGNMPIGFVRAILQGEPIPQDADFNWRFAD